jgi:hypothetical protein
VVVHQLLEALVEAALDGDRGRLVQQVTGKLESKTLMLLLDLVGPSHSPPHGRRDQDALRPHPELVGC